MTIRDAPSNPSASTTTAGLRLSVFDWQKLSKSSENISSRQLLSDDDHGLKERESNQESNQGGSQDYDAPTNHRAPVITDDKMSEKTIEMGRIPWRNGQMADGNYER